MLSNSYLEKLALDTTPMELQASGRVTQINGTIIHAELPAVSMYALCKIERDPWPALTCQVVGFKGNQVQLAPLGRVDGARPNAQVTHCGTGFTCSIPVQPLGLVLDALGNVLGSSSSVTTGSDTIQLDLRKPAPGPLERQPIKDIFTTGVRSIDGLCPIGRGQRMAILASPGSGKSTLVGMIAGNSTADVIVIGLIGERGREVKHFIDHVLGEKQRQRTVVVVATSDEPPLCRQLAANSATAIAEYYRDQGKNVLLIIDSLTRYARALREVTLAAGELPIRQGFTPSVFTELPVLLERAGNNANGTITAIYTVLTQTDMANDVLSEELTSILDGHLILSPRLVDRGIRPAIDPSQSLSRLLPDLVSAEQLQKVKKIQSLFAVLEEERDLISLGGSPSELMHVALKMEHELMNFLQQVPTENIACETTKSQLNELYTKMLSYQTNSVAK